MIPGAPVESRWFRSEPQRDWPAGTLEAMAHAAFPSGHIVELLPLTQGRRNANFKLKISGRPEPVVLRIYQHDPSLCRKEIDIIRLVQGSLPVPEVIHAQPEPSAALPPFIFMRYLEGISFRELLKSGDSESIAQASRSAGQTLKHISRFSFDKGGWLGPGPRPTAPLLEGADPIPRFVDACLSSAKLQLRLPEQVRERAHDLMWSSRDAFARIEDECCLVHGDFNKRNLLVGHHAGSWKVTGVLDWEFAISASPLGDCGNLLRYERRAQPLIEPHFSQGYLEEGGLLPPDWLRMARLVDMIALCESLTRDELPADVIAELTELVRSTIEDRDPEI